MHFRRWREAAAGNAPTRVEVSDGKEGGGRGWMVMMKKTRKRKKGEGREEREYYIINCGAYISKIIKVGTETLL